ncbi:hypothetical protein [Pseudoxanthomonas winnipegensis]|uniref:hypothetical protein n=1 Tax=Pseudoxanthomonas winnipegensis TaxID=2480810 RepID=UPI00103D189E|nr:hypothetical protein [Pseudoxanthomonas winnipegensis]TBV74805.1 hypothetical protein EYC45_08785 [Pseudoxanthomonas winnipegensis]
MALIGLLVSVRENGGEPDQKKQRWDYFMDGGTDAWCGGCSEEVGQELEWGDPAEWVEPEEDEDDEDEEEDGDA